jgi:hypothetical protein
MFLLPNQNTGDGPMTLEDEVHALRLHLFRRAQEIGNVSAACLGGNSGLLDCEG